MFFLSHLNHHLDSFLISTTIRLALVGGLIQKVYHSRLHISRAGILRVLGYNATSLVVYTMPSPRPRTPTDEGYGTISSSNYDTESGSSSPHGTDYHERDALIKHQEPAFDRARRKSFIDDDEDPFQIEPPTMKKKEEAVTWSSLPHKSQLAILTIARLSEPLVQTSLRVSGSATKSVTLC